MIFHASCMECDWNYWLLRYWLLRYWLLRYWLIRYWLFRYWLIRYWLIKYWLIRYYSFGSLEDNLTSQLLQIIGINRFLPFVTNGRVITYEAVTRLMKCLKLEISFWTFITNPAVFHQLFICLKSSFLFRPGFLESLSSYCFTWLEHAILASLLMNSQKDENGGYCPSKLSPHLILSPSVLYNEESTIQLHLWQMYEGSFFSILWFSAAESRDCK